MATALDLLHEARFNEVKVSLHDGKLRCEPRFITAPIETLMQQLGKHKTEIVAILKEESKRSAPVNEWVRVWQSDDYDWPFEENQTEAQRVWSLCQNAMRNI